MALVDQGNNSSPYEFENMLPLDVLAAVASETLRNEIHTNDYREKKVSPNFKRHAKKSQVSGMSFEDVKSLPIKALVEKFSEMTSDELTKKYFYKCLLIPQQCTMIFKSFGNEKKACDKMKSHLLSHLQQLSADYESNKETFATVFIPKASSSNSKSLEKLSKKSKKHVLLYTDLSQKAPKSSKKKNSVYSLKKMEKLYSLNKKEASVESQSAHKIKQITDPDIYLKRKSSNKKNDKGLSNVHIKKEPEEPQDSSDGECERGKYNSYSEYLKNTFLSGDFLDSESFEYSTVMSGDSEAVSEKEPTASLSVNNTLTDLSLQDHNYAMSEGVTKCDKLLSQELKHFSRRNIICFSSEPVVQPQLIIRTPPFPFVHTPLLPEVAEIKEVGLEEVDPSEFEFYPSADQLCRDGIGDVIKQDLEEETLSDPEEKFSQSIFYKTNVSVLECVENLVNGKYAGSCLPEVPASTENEENLENLQRIEKELALKYIAKLHAKKKRRIPDSLMCQICPDKHFTAQATLIHHYRSHAGIKPYVCKICAATFTRQHSLNYHMLIHQNRSRFTCEFCGRTFRHPSHYKEHLRRHTGETPYHCTDCNLHFKTRNTFKRHLKTRHAKLLTASGIEDLSLEDYAVIKFSPKMKLGK